MDVFERGFGEESLDGAGSPARVNTTASWLLTLGSMQLGVPALKAMTKDKDPVGRAKAARLMLIQMGIDLDTEALEAAERDDIIATSSQQVRKTGVIDL